MDSEQKPDVGWLKKLMDIFSEDPPKKKVLPPPPPPKEDLTEEDVKANKTIEEMMKTFDFDKYVPRYAPKPQEVYPYRSYNPPSGVLNDPRTNTELLEKIRDRTLELIDSTCVACRCHIGTAILPPEVRLDYKYGEGSTFIMVCPTCGYRMLFEVEGLE